MQLYLYIPTIFVIVNAADRTIECGDTLDGSIGYSPDSVTFEFVNDQIQDVTFSNCDSDFDTTLYLYDSDENEIQSQSTNQCDGDDCSDYSVCTASLRETFTMSGLAEGTYELKLQPYSNGGDYVVEAICGSSTPAPTFDEDCYVWTEIDGFSGDESVLNGLYIYHHDAMVYNRTSAAGSNVYEMRESSNIWGIYANSDDDHMAYCSESDIMDCAGLWRVYSSFLETWIIDDDVTFLHSDCDPPDDCDVGGLTERDMDCMSFTVVFVYEFMI